MSIAYHRRWYRRYTLVSYVSCFAAGWLLIHHDFWWAAFLLMTGVWFAIGAAFHATQETPS